MAVGLRLNGFELVEYWWVREGVVCSTGADGIWGVGVGGAAEGGFGLSFSAWKFIGIMWRCGGPHGDGDVGATFIVVRR